MRPIRFAGVALFNDTAVDKLDGTDIDAARGL